MSSDTIDSMAMAVLVSAVVNGCVSPAKYQRSSPCRLEMTYACQLKIPVIPVMVAPVEMSDWLGLLMSSKLYYDVGCDVSNSTALEGLLAKLMEFTAASVAQASPAPPAVPVKKLVDLGVDETAAWLANSGLGDYCDAFKQRRMCGRSLRALFRAYISPHTVLPRPILSVLEDGFKMVTGDAFLLLGLLSTSFFILGIFYLLNHNMNIF
jgi:hypothetical protein